jgi:hypothetical protein
MACRTCAQSGSESESDSGSDSDEWSESDESSSDEEESAYQKPEGARYGPIFFLKRSVLEQMGLAPPSKKGKKVR